MNVLSVTVSEKNGKEARGKKRKGRCHGSVGSYFLELFYSDIRGVVLLYFLEGAGSGGPPPGEISVKYMQNCDILNQLGRKTLPTGQFLFLTFGYWNGIEIITDYFEN